MLKELRPALVSSWLTAITGLIYPLVVTGIAQVVTFRSRRTAVSSSRAAR